MSGIPRYAARRDKVEIPMVKQLRDIPGVSVVVISVKNVGDILVGREVNGKKRTWLFELKSKGGKLTDGQKTFHAEWTGQHHIVSSIEEILEVIGF